MTRLATDAVARVFRQGFRYSKAEVLLLDLRQPGEFSEDLFALKQSVACDRLMQVMDNINERWGRGTMRASSVPVAPEWGMRGK
ncbi:DNA polymerase V [Pseudomonas sp. BP8]|nr:DNA polymerase V [Pseudomonas sp. BP8]